MTEKERNNKNKILKRLIFDARQSFKVFFWTNL